MEEIALQINDNGITLIKSEFMANTAMFVGGEALFDENG